MGDGVESGRAVAARPWELPRPPGASPQEEARAGLSQGPLPSITPRIQSSFYSERLPQGGSLPRDVITFRLT